MAKRKPALFCQAAKTRKGLLALQTDETAGTTGV
jgi:hypothetical protein